MKDKFPNPNPRGQISGLINITCPDCGTLMQLRSKPGHWKIYCGHCPKEFAVGINLGRMPTGRCRAPFDISLPVYVFNYRSGGRVHSVSNVEDSKQEIAEPDERSK